MSKFDLEFSITRRFPWPYFTPIVLSISAMSLVALTVLNVRLAGYETVTSLKEDFNITQPSWLDHVNPNSQGQSLCQPVVLNLGDSFVTNSSMFLWVLELVTTANHSSSGLIYKGSTLRGCDVISLYLNGRDDPTMDIVAVVSCEDLDGFDVVAKTAFPISLMPGSYTRFRSKLSRLLPYHLIELAASDLLTHAEALFISDKNLLPVAISAEVTYISCPVILGIKAPCATDPQPVDITSSLVIYNSTYRMLSPNSSAFVQSYFYEPLYNLIQTIHAAMHIDLGIPHENNFLLNPSMLNKTLYSEFPAAALQNATVSTLYQAISTGNFSKVPIPFPLKMAGPAKLEARYLCHLQKMKPPAQAFIAVLVATLSMFISGWGLFMLLATYWAKHGNDSANSCVSHDIEVGARVPLLPVT